jgi:putative transposase
LHNLASSSVLFAVLVAFLPQRQRLIAHEAAHLALLFANWQQFVLEGPETLHADSIVWSASKQPDRRVQPHDPQEARPEHSQEAAGSALWSPSYFAGRCGGAPIEIIRQYIEQQHRLH